MDDKRVKDIMDEMTMEAEIELNNMSEKDRFLLISLVHSVEEGDTKLSFMILVAMYSKMATRITELEEKEKFITKRYNDSMSLIADLLEKEKKNEPAK